MMPELEMVSDTEVQDEMAAEASERCKFLQL